VRPKTLLAWIAGVLMALAAVVYAGDLVWFEYRMRNAKPNDPLETVTFYYATAMKNGKVEVFYNQPQMQTCVHGLFPHQGYTPCWRFNRSGIKRISAIIPLPNEAFLAPGLVARSALGFQRDPSVKKRPQDDKTEIVKSSARGRRDSSLRSE
jgi:hypothetical protein